MKTKKIRMPELPFSRLIDRLIGNRFPCNRSAGILCGNPTAASQDGDRPSGDAPPAMPPTREALSGNPRAGHPVLGLALERCQLPGQGEDFRADPLRSAGTGTSSGSCASLVLGHELQQSLAAMLRPFLHEIPAGMDRLAMPHGLGL